MERQKGDHFTFTGRWRGRRTWALVLSAFFSVALTLALLWYLPTGRGNEDLAANAAEGDGGPGEGAGRAGDLPAEGQSSAQGDGHEGLEAAPAPTPEGDVPGMVVEFPDPAGGGLEPPPPQGYGDVLGAWILEMSGPAYGIANCHVRLEEGGKLTTPPEYGQLFVINESEYLWERQTNNFAAAMLVTVKLGPSQVAVPAEIYLVGQVAGALNEITGDFIAEPQGEAYAPYAQKGTFRMRR